ncbi:MAG: rhodanese-like domain-containing protein [Treponema sp.]|nr:rhodanese-like domain-containing protein [Treponema sp.]
MKKLLCMIFLIPFGLTGSCSSQEQPKDGKKASIATVQKISSAQAKAMMDEGKPYTLLDVRTDAEFKERRISGAILIPDYEIEARAEKELPDKNAVILIYCRSGARSARSAQTLVNMGYTNIYDFGGIINWPFETISD